MAQTVVWQMPLTNYSNVTRVAPNLYKVTRQEKVGLIHSDGYVVVSLFDSRIGDFYEHKALLTATDNQKGCLTDERKYYPFTNKYYTLSGQEFFSDDLLSVSDADV